MADISTLERGLWLLGLVLTGLFLAKLILTRLFLRYRALMFALSVSLVRTLILLQLDVNGGYYALVWMATAPLIWLSYFLVALEISAFVFESYRGLAVFSRRVVHSALLISLLVAGAVIVPSIRLDGEPFPKLLLAMVLEKAVAVSLLLFFAALSGFMVWYSIPLRKNLIVYALGYSFFFLATAAAIFLRGFAGNEATRAASTVLLGMNAACVLGWFLLVGKAGEREHDSVGLSWRRGQAAEILARLDAINAALLGSGRQS